MKTKIVIDLLRYWGNHCDAHISNGEYQVEGSVLLKSAAQKIERLCEDVSERNEKIGKLKKNNRKLKKELAEREAAPGWISVEDIPVPPEKYFVFTVLPKIIIKRNPETGEPAYWMPLPDPPDPPKKVKTYKDVFFEAFPNAPLAKEIDGIPAACRSLIFGKSNKCSMDPNCEDCWNQPYPEEEGGAE